MKLIVQYKDPKKAKAILFREKEAIHFKDISC